MTKLTEIETAIMNEAFMEGRLYHSLGEKESPVTIHDKVLNRCVRVKELKMKEIKETKFKTN